MTHIYIFAIALFQLTRELGPLVISNRARKDPTPKFSEVDDKDGIFQHARFEVGYLARTHNC